MKKRVLVVVLAAFGIAAFFATAAEAVVNVVYLAPHNMVWPGHASERSGFTGVGYLDNAMRWDYVVGNPYGCTNYVDTNNFTIFSNNTCGNGGAVFDSRDTSSYAAAWCEAKPSNSNDLLFTAADSGDCETDRN